MQRPLHLCDELLRTPTQQQRASLCLCAVLKDVVSLSADLLLLKLATSTEVLVLDV
jgi:hypothetical protein